MNGRPLEITKAVGKTMYIFTDGAFEPSSSTPGTLGGILYNECGVYPINFFSEVVPDRLMEAYYLHTSKNPIYLMELLAVFVAIRLWGEACKNNFVVNFVDNEASRSALIKAWSDTALAKKILFACMLMTKWNMDGSHGLVAFLLTRILLTIQADL